MVTEGPQNASMRSRRGGTRKLRDHLRRAVKDSDRPALRVLAPIR